MGRENMYFHLSFQNYFHPRPDCHSVQYLSHISKTPIAINRFLSSSGNSLLLVLIHWRLFLCKVCFTAFLPSSCPCISNFATSFETSSCNLVQERLSSQAQVSDAFQTAFSPSPIFLNSLSFWSHSQEDFFVVAICKASLSKVLYIPQLVLICFAVLFIHLIAIKRQDSIKHSTVTY